jgi:molybdate transport system ATP-binding protein
MDEPLSKLDGERKAGVAAVIAALRDRLDLPILYVTHDRREVEELADHIVLLGDRRVRACGSAASVLADLDLPFAAESEAASVIAARVTAYDPDYDLTRVAAGGHTLWLPGVRGRAGDALRVLIRAGDVTLYRESPDGGSALNNLTCRIGGVRFERGTAVVRLELADDQGVFIAHVTRLSFDRLGLTAGDTVHALVKATSSRRH